LTENYEKFEQAFKEIKEKYDTQDNPINNKNFDMINPSPDKNCLWYINGKIQYMIINDVEPILNLWRKLAIFAEVDTTNLREYSFDLKKFASDE